MPSDKLQHYFSAIELCTKRYPRGAHIKIPHSAREVHYQSRGEVAIVFEIVTKRFLGRLKNAVVLCDPDALRQGDASNSKATTPSATADPLVDPSNSKGADVKNLVPCVLK